ncbi:helix-turn-helix transcriptional regulator [Komarekiella delphini-convector]|nr:helix-turn-helix transcriptional regulator [Komarekiella delphini-convector]
MTLRESLGLTQRQVAEAVGVTDQTVSNWSAEFMLRDLP